MKNPLESLHLTLLGGLVLAVIAYLVLHSGALGDGSYWTFFFRWLHVLAGVLWIGLLYYFNFVQIPTMPRVPDELKPAVGRFIAPQALFWFRWAAAATVLFGAITAHLNGYLLDALLFRNP